MMCCIFAVLSIGARQKSFTELGHFLLGPEDAAIGILSFAENACGEEGRRKFAVLETKRGMNVAEIWRSFEALQANQDRNSKNCSIPSGT